MAAERAPRNNGSQWDGGFAALHVFENLESNRCDHVTAMAKKSSLGSAHRGLSRKCKIHHQNSEVLGGMRWTLLSLSLCAIPILSYAEGFEDFMERQKALYVCEWRTSHLPDDNPHPSDICRKSAS
jgi:hypothetical protein